MACQSWWLVLVALLAGPAAALGQVGLERVSPFPVLRGADGTRAVLGGIVVPEGQAGAAGAVAGAWLEQGGLELEILPGAPDRHGRVQAVPRRGGEALQTALLRAGLAIAAPESGAGTALLRAEAEARAAGRGVWGEGAHGPYPAASVPLVEGRFVLVEGRMARVARTSRYWYANFGRSFRTDFTVRIPLAAEAAFVAAGLDPAGLEGRRVRVRGWLFEENGPMIEIAHPFSLELLP